MELKCDNVTANTELCQQGLASFLFQNFEAADLTSLEAAKNKAEEVKDAADQAKDEAEQKKTKAETDFLNKPEEILEKDGEWMQKLQDAENELHNIREDAELAALRVNITSSLINLCKDPEAGKKHCFEINQWKCELQNARRIVTDFC